jgi:hypothetical protein
LVFFAALSRDGLALEQAIRLFRINIAKKLSRRVQSALALCAGVCPFLGGA